jgi:hypothetical protein
MVDKALKMIEYPLRDCTISSEKLSRYVQCYMKYAFRCLLNKVEPLTFNDWFMEISRLHDKAHPTPPKRRVKIIDARKVTEEEPTPLKLKSKRWFRK